MISMAFSTISAGTTTKWLSPRLASAKIPSDIHIFVTLLLEWHEVLMLFIRFTYGLDVSGTHGRHFLRYFMAILPFVFLILFQPKG